MLSVCKIPGADNYSKGCELSSFAAGWKVTPED
jgi:hypothetical protein